MYMNSQASRFFPGGGGEGGIRTPIFLVEKGNIVRSGLENPIKEAKLPNCIESRFLLLFFVYLMVWFLPRPFYC